MTIYFGVFIFHRLPVSMQYMLSICDFMYRKKRIVIILLPIFNKLQFVVSICQKASQGTISYSWN